jgi:hypothetical protein
MNNVRLLALDLRTRRFGFAVLEGPQDLLEWGSRRLRRTSMSDPESFIRRRLAPLVKLYAPTVIVVKRGSRQGAGNNSKHEYLLQMIMKEAQRQAIAVAVIGRKEMRSVFGETRRATKETIAQQVAARFPQLKWKLPPARKPWANEAHAMTIFDAVALGLTYLSRFQNIRSIDYPDNRLPAQA